MKQLVTALLVVSLVVASVHQTAGFQKGAKGAKPETSKVDEFDPTALSKLAILLVGNENPREVQRNPQREIQTDHQRLVEDVFLESLLAKGHTVAARSDVESVFKEKKFQSSGMTEELAASVGKLLNVPAVLVIRVTEDSVESANGSNFSTSNFTARAGIGARLINVQTGAILWNGKHSDSEQVTARDASSGILLKTAAALAEAFPEKKAGYDPTSERPIDPKSVAKLAVITVSGASHPGSQFMHGPTNLSGAGMRGPNQVDAQTDQQRQVEDAFIQVLIEKGYHLVSRSDLQSVAKEQQFQKSGLTEDNAVAVGKLLNVPAVLMVRITDYAADTHQAFGMSGLVQPPGAKQGTRQPGGATKRQEPHTTARAALAARLIDVSRGEVWWTHGTWTSKEVTSKGDATKVLDYAAKEVADYFPPAPESQKALLAQAGNLERLGQITAALYYYRSVSKKYPDSSEGKKAETRLKALTNKK